MLHSECVGVCQCFCYYTWILSALRFYFLTNLFQILFLFKREYIMLNFTEEQVTEEQVIWYHTSLNSCLTDWCLTFNLFIHVLLKLWMKLSFFCCPVCSFERWPRGVFTRNQAEANENRWRTYLHLSNISSLVSLQNVFSCFATLCANEYTSGEAARPYCATRHLHNDLRYHSRTIQCCCISM